MYEGASKQSLDPKSYIAQGLRLGSNIPGSATVNNAKKIKSSALIVNKVCLLEYSFKKKNPPPPKKTK